ncbi:hypothetical protein B0T16DRAFT_400637, partial [Cercophora newfieldiana]
MLWFAGGGLARPTGGWLSAPTPPSGCQQCGAAPTTVMRNIAILASIISAGLEATSKQL